MNYSATFLVFSLGLLFGLESAQFDTDGLVFWVDFSPVDLSDDSLGNLQEDCIDILP